MVGVCPFHEDRAPSFVVSPVEELVALSWGVPGGRVSVVDFVMRAEGVSFPACGRAVASGRRSVVDGKVRKRRRRVAKLPSPLDHDVGRGS